ncbi:bifunctional helix-turn-helix transcriptional regulator/GNAT family N-acetyltransferase [Microlunatus parietis]|uniref:DNA-binding MarR family transcriptional regulator/GNAT superfamily N-acetyltransferase n=1 Tax=Microlunatus parietis TaxID=682979 RepID=A0A7Y9IDQ8_9ACTN|nr:helix-turn-helix domain-containing GNAT family N-acetyltransferase [Microlunatus parietis]NYE75071.1 DNA-binding MarR family transcriptional regulator/GNAT superfamily N-acetyltransferase [Microlunatus parietis]
MSKVSVDPATVDRVRSFNRFYTKIIGVLDEGLAGSPFSLTEARVLFELAAVGRVDIVGLRTELGLDPGYATRILDRLGAAGLVERERSATDKRRQTVTLTEAGRAAFEELLRGSVGDVSGLLAPLRAPDRARLVDAMSTVRTLLEPAGEPPRVELRGPEPGDLGWVVERNAVLYAEEYGWDATYEALVARIVADFAATAAPDRARVWIATVDGQRAGSVFCVRDDDETARLRLLLTEPWARGLGLGTRLVDACIEFARSAGYRRLVLWTNDVLVAARRIYQRAGFRLVDEERHHSFGTDLVGQTWELDL